MKNQLNILLALVLFILASKTCFSQAAKQSFLAIGHSSESANSVHGMSVNIISWNGERTTGTNGIRLEIIGGGILFPIKPLSMVVETEREFQNLNIDRVTEQVNGLNISAAGAICECMVNGASIGYIGQYNQKVNGLMASVYSTEVQELNGLQLSIFNINFLMRGVQVGISNYSYRMRGLQAGGLNFTEEANGLQVGITNRAKNLKGIQIGLWNVNQKRKLPLINWNFKST